ncbi:MAG: Gfo/Idh/MocA family oxidoreductase [Planctomycetes bacterium]|nr:Gfo/Idh/MocA family oxidoreductase [Planctomycetota bacterium]
MNRKITRRDAIKSTAALAAGLYFGAAASRTRAAGPNEKLNLACIGVGGRGAANVAGLASQNLVAFADVDERRASESTTKFPKAKQFRDYRKLLDELGSKLDAVVISTPDHTHFHPAYAAMQLGLHVYLEKPLAHNVWETRTLTNFAREKKLATQLGSQRHAIGNVHRVVELIQSGAIGPVAEVHSWVAGGRGMPKLPTDQPAVPKHLDYDVWLGPAKQRPYHPSFCPYGWRFWWDFGTGETGNWGCHILDIPFWALGLKYPTRVDATGPEVDAERTPKTMHATLKFPARGEQPPVTLHWYQGEPAVVKQRGLSGKGQNTLFIGRDGMLLCGFESRQLLPKEKFADAKAPAKTVADSPGFYNEWIAACKGGQPATCNFDYSGPLAEAVLLGNVAYRAGGFDWDSENLKTTGNDKAQALIREAYREGWEIKT